MKTFDKSMCFSLVYVLQVVQSFHCTFESGLCVWEQDSSDHFNWTRYRGNTPSEYTGPSSDHTTGNGYYIYIESSPPREAGDKARLISPKINPGSYCLVFWYFMYGQHIHTLKVYKKSEAVNNDTAIFKRKGNNASVSEWKKGLASLRYSDEFQIVFEGVVGGPKGDIAVDDISLTNGTCSADCDFDSDFCNWTQVNGDDFDWVIVKGSSQTLGTVPFDDHTGGGQYVYIDTSFPRESGDMARLVGPGQGSGVYCLKFWYSMYGRHINRLNVYQKTDEGNETLLISIQNATEVFAWMENVYSFQAEAEYQIVFEGVCGDGSEGDIAVDDISLIPERCITESTSVATIPISTHVQISEETSSLVSRVTDMTEDSTKGMQLNSLTDISTRYVTTAVVKANSVLSSSTLNMAGSTSKNTLMSILTTSPIQTNIQNNSNTKSTRGAEKSASLTTHSFFSPSKEIMNSHLTSHTSKMYDTMTTDAKQIITSTELPQITRTLITLSTSSSSSLKETLHTDKPIPSTVTEVNENSLVTLYTALIAITSTLVVLVIALFIFMCRRRQGKNQLTAGCRDHLTYEDECSVAVTNVINKNMLTNKLNSQFRINNSELCQEQYTEVSLECIQPATGEEGVLNSEYSATLFNTQRVQEEKQAYNHMQVQRKAFIDLTYSHISHTCGNRSESLEKESTKYAQIIDEVSDLDISGGSRVPDGNNGIETFTQNEFDENQDIMYDHLVPSAKSNIIQKDDYSHLTKTSNRGSSRDYNYGYSIVLKKKKNGGSDFEFFEKDDEEKRNRNSLEHCQNEDNCQKYTINSVDIIDNNTINHDYFILEKVDK